MVDQASRLAGLRLVNPHRDEPGTTDGWRHDVVTAGGDAPLPGTSAPLEVAFAGAGRMWTLPQWSSATHATALLVLDRGRVVHEWYAEDVAATDLLLGASMTKSVLAHLVGVAVRAGELRVDDEVTGHVPALTGSGYDGCTVEHLLTMTTGVDWVEDHRDPGSSASRLLACFLTGSGGSRELLAAVPPAVEPGTRFEYSTADSQVLDWVREAATGATYQQALAALWRALGCAEDAVVATDGPGGTALAGGGLAATARDWARLVALQVDGTAGGSGTGARVLDEEWVTRGSAPGRPFLVPGRLPSSITTHAGFGFHWWPLDAAGRRVTADGSRGQFGYVDRDEGVVVVRTSRWPYDEWLTDRQHRDLCYLGLPAVAAAAVRERGAGPVSGPGGR